MSRPVSTGGNGDVCPANPDHARMYLMEKSRRQFCAHSDHSRVSDPAVFEYDGVTPASRPAPEKPPAARQPSRKRRGSPRGEADREPITTPEQLELQT